MRERSSKEENMKKKGRIATLLTCLVAEIVGLDKIGKWSRELKWKEENKR